MTKNELIKHLVELGELNQESNKEASAIIFTLANLCGDNKETALLGICDLINDIYINNLQTIKHEI